MNEQRTGDGWCTVSITIRIAKVCAKKNNVYFQKVCGISFRSVPVDRLADKT